MFILNQNILVFKKNLLSSGVFFTLKIYLHSIKKELFNKTFLLDDFW